MPAFHIKILSCGILIVGKLEYLWCPFNWKYLWKEEYEGKFKGDLINRDLYSVSFFLRWQVFLLARFYFLLVSISALVCLRKLTQSWSGGLLNRILILYKWCRQVCTLCAVSSFCTPGISWADCRKIFAAAQIGIRKSCNDIHKLAYLKPQTTWIKTKLY